MENSAQAPRPIRAVRVAAAGATDVGRVADHDDDTVLIRPEMNLFIAADGAGGHNAGNVASALAAKSVAEFLEMTSSLTTSRPEVDAFGLQRDARRLATAVQFANRQIRNAGDESEARRGMGTTIVALLVAPNAGVAHLAYVGDSRCYRLRDGRLDLMTFDHSLLHDILELRPDIDDAALARLPPNVLTRALGMEDSVRVSVRSFEVAPADRFLLCSDGLSDAIQPEAIAEHLALPYAPTEIVKALIAAANDAGGPDNITSLVVVCESADRAAAEQRLPLPRPRKKRGAAPPGPEVSLEGDTEEPPDIVIEDGESEPETEAPDLEWDADAPAGSAGAKVMQVLDELIAVDSRLGAAIDRVSGRDAETGGGGRCVKCTAAIDPEVNFCGFCGARQNDVTA